MKWNDEDVNAAMSRLSEFERKEAAAFFLQAAAHDYAANPGFIHTGKHLDARAWIDGIREKHIRFSISRPSGAGNGIVAWLK